VIASYGQEQEFDNALPGIIGPLPDLISYTRERRQLGADRDIIIIEKRTADGSVSKERYKLERHT
jgi:hypothetical protein